jgi:hypothetical protein
MTSVCLELADCGVLQQPSESPASREAKRRRISLDPSEDDATLPPPMERTSSPSQQPEVSETSFAMTPARAAASSIGHPRIKRPVMHIDAGGGGGYGEAIAVERPDTPPSAHEDDMDDELDPNDPYAYLGERAKALKRERELAAARTNEERAEEPIIELFMDSHIPNLRNLLIKVRFSQQFKEVREAFCKNNGLSKEQSREVIFMWKGLRLYDGSSCKGLSSIELSPGGLPIMRLPNGRDESAQQIVLVVTTKAIDIQEKAEAERQKQAALEAEARGGAEVAVEKEKLYRIVLRSKGYDDYKLRVKFSTEISSIIGAFRRHSNSEKSLSIRFDGEELGPEMKIGDTEVAEAEEPMLLDVYEK